MVLHDMITSLT